MDNEMKFAFSTAWLDGDISRLDKILPYIDSIEIGTKGDGEFFKAIIDIVKKSGKMVTSIHASSGPHKTTKEAYYTPHFSSRNRNLRMNDIEQVALSADWAQKLGARAVILHIGRIEDPLLKQMFLMYKEKILGGERDSELKEMKSEIIQRRKTIRGDFIESAVIGLKELCQSFPDITFCVETRVHFYEIPLPDEAEYIFNRLQIPNLGYWHDIGHTYILSKLGFVPMNLWQNQLREKCIGTHIHDVDQSLRDHLPPGSGTLDLHSILSQFQNNILHTLEINSQNSTDSVLNGIEYVRNFK